MPGGFLLPAITPKDRVFKVEKILLKLKLKIMIFAYQDNCIDYSELYEYSSAVERSLLRYTCPYCNLQCISFTDDSGYSTAEWSNTITICLSCGWWSYKYNESADLSGNSYFFSSQAILKSFNIDSQDVPLIELLRHIKKNERQIHNISPKKMEELVQAVYKEAFGNKVESCSYCRPDRGIDIICIQSDSSEKYAIQVERYKNPIKLKSIHQFFGAMVENQFQKEAFISTGKFKNGSYSVAENLGKISGFHIDLKEGKKFLDFLNILRGQNNLFKCPYWKRYGYYCGFGTDERAESDLNERIKRQGSIKSSK